MDLDLKIRLSSQTQAKSVVLESFTKLLRLSFGLVYLGVGLPFVNTHLHMAAVIFLIQYLKC